MASTRAAAAAADISGTRETAVVRAWFTVGCFFLLFMGWVVWQWVSAPTFGPTRLPEGVTVPAQFRYAIRGLEIGLPIVWAYFIYTQIIRPIRESGQPNTLGLCGIAFFVAIFWDPSMNWIQQGCVYNAYAFNLGFLSNNIPGWMSPRGELLPEPLIAWTGGYPAFLIWGCLSGLAAMRFVKAKVPTISNLPLALIGVVTVMIFDMLLEMALIRGSALYAYPGSIRAVSINAGHWYQFPIYEALLFGGWWGLCAVLLYFKDDKGLTWVERGVEKIDMCRRSGLAKGLVRAVAVIGFCQTIEFIIYVLPMPLLTANADPFPDDTPAFFTVGSGMCGDGTGIACARPDIPIIRRNDLEKFRNTIQYSNEAAMAHAAGGGASGAAHP